MRTPLMRALRGVAARQSRGEFVRSLGVTAAAASLLPEFVACSSSRPRGRERIAIVGAGIAGLVAAMHLRDAGIDATIYESSNRVGGRMHSERTYWSDGQHTEWCGAMIDSLHSNMRSLAKRFGLPLLDTHAAWPAGARDTCYINGRYYSMADADRDFANVYPILQNQLGTLPDEITFANATEPARKLDATSIAQWIAEHVPGGASSQLGELIGQAYRNEYGRENDELSALNLVTQLGDQRSYAGRRRFNILGYSDQRYTLAAGNQTLPETIATVLPQGSIVFNHRLRAISRTPSGVYKLTFGTDSAAQVVEADRVVLAIPFIILRGIDYSGANFSAAKRRAIETLGYGYHTKLHVQFDERAWNHPKAPLPEPTTGQIYSNLPFQTALDFSLGQPGRDGLIEVFTGANEAMSDTPPQPYARIEDAPGIKRHVRAFFEQLDRVWPGVSQTWNGKATFGNAQADPNILASYSCWLVGQYTTIAGHEAPPEGRVHFAGEHTSLAYQGFMEGGAESGFRAAREILAEYHIAERARTT